MGALLAVGGLLAVPGCGDDTTEGTTTGTTTTTATTTTTTTTTTGTGGAGGDGGSGGGAATPTCANYCALIQANCTNDNAQYSDEANCLATCAVFDIGQGGDVDGDTLGCREYHAGDPAAMAPETHCIHAGPLGGATCGTDPCVSFCAIATTLCTPADHGWDNAMECANECAGFPTDVVYNAGVTDGDSLACRMYHLQVASVTADPHCTHINEASPTCVAP